MTFPSVAIKAPLTRQTAGRLQKHPPTPIIISGHIRPFRRRRFLFLLETCTFRKRFLPLNRYGMGGGKKKTRDPVPFQLNRTSIRHVYVPSNLDFLLSGLIIPKSGET